MNWSTFAIHFPGIFTDIMTNVGLDSPESLLRCMKVCRTWDEQIISLIWDSEGSKKIMMERFKRSWSPGMLPTDEEIANATWLGDSCLILKFIYVTLL